MPSAESLNLLQELCTIPATAGDEQVFSDWILRYVLDHQTTWRKRPEIFAGEGFQESIVLVFGQPRMAVFAHLDGVGFCTAYGNGLVPIGKPKAASGAVLQGTDRSGHFTATLQVEDVEKEDQPGTRKKFTYTCDREVERGIPLTYKPNWRETETHVQCAYLDNRVGVWNALELCKHARDVAIVFSTYEEHGGGSAQFLGRFLYKSFGCRQALISDVTLASEGIVQDGGVAISLRDRGIPRQRFVRKIRRIASAHQVPHQLEVEDAGGSDGNQLQASSYAWDWCFIGPPETGYHTPDESIHKNDLDAMRKLYDILLDELP